MQKQVEGSMFGAVLLKLDCLVTGSSGVGGGGQHSTRDSLTGDFLSFNSEKNEGCFFIFFFNAIIPGWQPGPYVNV